MTSNETPTLNPDAVYTPNDVAKILACSRAHVYRLIRTGHLRHTDISSPESKVVKARILGSELAAFLSENTR